MDEAKRKVQREARVEIILLSLDMMCDDPAAPHGYRRRADELRKQIREEAAANNGNLSTGLYSAVWS